MSLRAKRGNLSSFFQPQSAQRVAEVVGWVLNPRVKDSCATKYANHAKLVGCVPRTTLSSLQTLP